ncbi:acyltransferase [Tsukamurella soli]|uniref:Acyltransferase n=1 Tax=Tsukamurella soli TaxID=644556 RepID=A0ABP8JFT0_9ACTN
MSVDQRAGGDQEGKALEDPSVDGAVAAVADGGAVADPATGSGAPGATSGGSKPRKKSGHLYEIDFVRLITFAGVILDHCVSGTTVPTNVASNAIQMALHYTRNSFFALTGFVLVYQYRFKELKATTFWRRRFKLIGLPYLLWTVFYWLYHYTLLWPPYFGSFAKGFDSGSATWQSFKTLGYDIFSGNAWYHLYFVFCTMQVYVVFPWVLKFLRWSFGYHKYILAASFLFHVYVLHMMSGPKPAFFDTWLTNKLWVHLPLTMIPYQFFTVAGMIAAMHFDAFRAFVRRWWYAVLAATFVVGFVTVLYYLHRTHHMMASDAASVFKPYSVFLFMGIALSLYGIGTLWSERRSPGSIADNLMSKAADRSFGIFLVHGLSLQELAPTIQRFRFTVYAPWVTIVTYIACIAVTVVAVEVLRRSPLSLVTTGREMIPLAKQNVRDVLVFGVALIAVGALLQSVLDMPVGTMIWVVGVIQLLSTAGCLVAARRRTVAA